MIVKLVSYTGVTKKWRNKYKHKKNSWGYKYAREIIINGILVLKENDSSRIFDYKISLLMKASRRFYHTI
jgi:uridine kinase